jgi:hypothetical protein
LGNQTLTINILPIKQGRFSPPCIKKNQSKTLNFEMFNPHPLKHSHFVFLPNIKIEKQIAFGTIDYHKKKNKLEHVLLIGSFKK